ncbi:hypothetical protein CI644P6_00003 [Clostridium phage CI644P6]|nr:hypothetical protein CI644P5_00022 [Clostridium phage CI644P5]WAX11968.1 hypothetical protein CI644P6_00003 [Clostridium phage CI644P6]
MKSRQFIKIEMNKVYLITVNETTLNRYTCEVYGVKLVAYTFEEMYKILDMLDFMEVEVYSNAQI